MTMRTILVPIPDVAVDTVAIETALQIGKAVGAHVEGLYIQTPPPSVPQTVPLAGYEVPSYGRAADAMARAEEEYARRAGEREQKARQAGAEFRRLCHARGVPVVAADAFAPLPSASWHETEGLYANAVTMRAPAHDLMVVPNPSIAAPGREIAEHTLLDTGRPVLLSPARPAADTLASVMVAWYPSLQAWRAVAAALPLMAVAGRVEIVTIGEHERAVAASRSKVLRYLGWHGIRAEARSVAVRGRTIGDALLAEASEAEAGLLVMGAYSHSRLRELLLGGVTRHVLASAVVTPVLMAH